MKFFIIIFFLFNLTTAVFCQVNDEVAFFNYKYDKEYIKRNKILHVIVDDYIGKQKNCVYHFYFDKAGFLKQETVIDTNGIKVNDFFFQVNKEGDLVSRKNINYELNKTSIVYYYKVYKNDKLIKDSSSELPFVTEYTYNNEEQNIQSTITMYTANNNTVLSKRKIKNKYDDSGKLVEVKEVVYNENFDTTGFLYSHRLIKYNGNKVLKEQEMVIINPMFPLNKGTIEYLYDSSGNLTSIKSKVAASRFYNYNHRGLLSTKKTIMPDEFNHITFIDNYRYSFWK